MAFRFQRKESIRDGVQRIADEQIGKAIAELDDPDLSDAEKVHQLRKRCKKLRGLIRLVRPGFEKVYQQENVWFRDTARALSTLRDSKTIIDALDGLTEHFADEVNPSVFEAIRRELVARREQLPEEESDLSQRLETARERMQQARDRIGDWNGGIDRKALAAGLTKTYERCRRDLKQARTSPTPEALHEWRKRVKYHWYHIRLLENAWPELFVAVGEVAKQVSDQLGDDHDLAVLRSTLCSDPESFGGPELIDQLTGLIDRRRRQLQKRAFRDGRRLFCEKPKQFTNRCMRYWDEWRG
jgi:CHAD domain-containing protein